MIPTFRLANLVPWLIQVFLVATGRRAAAAAVSDSPSQVAARVLPCGTSSLLRSSPDPALAGISC